MITAVILAAGRGRRMGTDIPKQFLLADGEPILAKCIRVFDESPEIDGIVLAAARDYVSYIQTEIVERYGFGKVRKIVEGGAERWNSVWNALMVCPKGPEEYVLIHDGARPFVTEEILARTVKAVRTYRAVAVGMPSKDTVKIADEEGFAASTPDRSKVWMIQTPQAFATDLIIRANEKLFEEHNMENVTDDAMIVERSHLAKVKLVRGSYANIKVTTPEDLKFFHTDFGSTRTS